MKPAKVKIEVTTVYLRIYVNDIIHLSIKIDQFIGIQAYFIGTDSYIDYYTKSKTIDAVYTRKDIWLKILKQLQLKNII